MFSIAAPVIHSLLCKPPACCGQVGNNGLCRELYQENGPSIMSTAHSMPFVAVEIEYFCVIKFDIKTSDHGRAEARIEIISGTKARLIHR